MVQVSRPPKSTAGGMTDPDRPLIGGPVIFGHPLHTGNDRC
jgi:hypothetical protein